MSSTFQISRMAAMAFTLGLFLTRSALAAEPPKPLTFAWPEGLRGVVTVTKEQVRDGKVATRMTNRYVMSGSKRPGGYRLEFGDVEIDVDRNFGQLTDPQRAQMALLLQSALPTYLISDEGALESIERVDEFVAKQRALFEQFGSKDNEAERATRRRVMATFLTPQLLLASAQQEWNRQVGLWLGAPLELGQDYKLESTAELPILPGRRISIRATFKAVSQQSCERAGLKHKCLVIEYRSQPDPAEVATALSEVMAKSGVATPAAAQGFETALKFNQWFRLVTEPDTLVPHELHIRMQASMEAGSTQQETWIQFKYPTATP